MDTDIKITDWLASVSGVVAAVVGLLTLLTVYAGAMQMLSESRRYRHGLSWASLGPWQPFVSKRTLLGLQRRIFALTVSLKSLVGSKWQPDITFPRGFPKTEGHVEDGDMYVQAQASWVNFMQALGLSPTKKHLYEVRDAPDLINGIVPMPWTGRDLVGMCSILGFQSHEDKPSFEAPMPLPVQWSGPPGWLQFRTSPNGCVAEFCRRMELHNQISKELHDHAIMKGSGPSCASPDFLRSRLWNSINGLALKNNRALYLVTANFLDPLVRDEMDSAKKKQVLRPCHGLLSVTWQGELAFDRGLSMKDCFEFDRKHTEEEDVDHATYKYSLGDLYMDEELLRLVKEALLLLRPDGFYFSPTIHLYCDLSEIYEHIKELSNVIGEVFPTLCNDALSGKGVSKETAVKPGSSTSASPTPSLAYAPGEAYSGDVSLCFAMDLCNDLQRTRKTRQACFTVDDMRLMAKSVSALRDGALVSGGTVADVTAFLSAPVVAKDGLLDCGPLMASGDGATEDGRYETPLLADGSYTGKELVAAIAAALITYYWIEANWFTDVPAYDSTIPQSVLMC